MLRAALSSLLLLAACEAKPPPAQKGPPEGTFPSVERPVAAIVSSQFSDEASRERTGEALQVMNFVGIEPGETVADIGAGRGYYTVKLASRVGPSGRVYGEDIIQQTVAQLQARTRAASLANVTVVLGKPDDPELPPGSLDHALLVHMYHEIENPYALLWHLRTALKPGATVAIVDANRMTRNHGTPPWLLDCEVGAIGFTRDDFTMLEGGRAYVAVYKATEPRPKPLDIHPCRSAP